QTRDFCDDGYFADGKCGSPFPLLIHQLHATFTLSKDLCPQCEPGASYWNPGSCWLLLAL
ncbi:MAG TPA: hypothetical protein VN954_01540, partial [Ktedonobacteraceae bacterium]|nr:hypothetical protein [Ktedonobacteraceae bacterium]